ncbi:MAG TPA: hypothetical protein VFZ17_11920, partial [Acidimicrobiia bacterium]|nr:hypothetical protein [Acidimicrobiia bacterium]
SMPSFRMSAACDDEETHDMEHIERPRRSVLRGSVGRIAAVALTVGTLSAWAIAPGIATAATSPTTATEISTAKDSKLGTILVSGNTVYTLKSKKTCTAACLKVWRPVELPDGVTKPTAGDGVDASKLGTVDAADGAVQITYSGKPLYWFAKDKAPGDVHGNVTDKWGTGAAVVTAKASSGSGDSNAGTGGTAF